MKVDIVDASTVGPDLGEPLPYHPPVADPRSFGQVAPVAEDGMIDLENSDVNLSDWHVQDGTRKLRFVTVDGTHHVILRWDLVAFAGRKVAGRASSS